MDATTTMSVPNQWRYASFVYEASFSSVTGPYQILRVPSGSDPDNYKAAVSGRWLVDWLLVPCSACGMLSQFNRFHSINRSIKSLSESSQVGEMAVSI